MCIRDSGNLDKVQEEPSLMISKSYFQNIFVTRFNFGNKTPCKDACSVCIEVDVSMRAEKDQDVYKRQVVVREPFFVG